MAEMKGGWNSFLPFLFKLEAFITHVFFAYEWCVLWMDKQYWYLKNLWTTWFWCESWFWDFLAETRASRGGAIPQQKAQNLKIAHFLGRRFIFCMQGYFWPEWNHLMSNFRLLYKGAKRGCSTTVKSSKIQNWTKFKLEVSFLGFRILFV